MKIDWMKPLLGRPGPFATVYVDGSRGVEAGGRDLDGVVRAVRRDLLDQGAPPTLVDAVEERILQPVRVPGPHGRVIIADEDQGVLTERILAEPPSHPHAEFGPVPVLLEAARSANESVDFLLVVADRLGADLTWSWGGDPARQPQPRTVEGGHDEINKVRTGGLTESRIEARAEDSWGRNAEAVAKAVDKAVVDHRPELVVLTGDVRAVALVRAALARRTTDVLVEVAGGSRTGGAHEGRFDDKVRAAVAAYRDRRRAAVIDAFRQGQGRADGSVTSLGDVLTVLQRGQVAELLISDRVGPLEEVEGEEIWVGPAPTHVALSRQDVEALGVEDGIHPLPAAAALVRAAIGLDAGLTFVADDEVELVDGVGAVLRWHDASTPSESAPTMSGDRRRLRDVV